MKEFDLRETIDAMADSILPERAPNDEERQRREEQMRQHKLDRDRELAEEERQAIEDRRNTIIARGVPAKDVERIMADDLTPTEALRHAKKFFASSARMLVLSGARGCGKTTAAAWIAGHRIKPMTPAEAKEEALCLRIGGVFAPHDGRRFIDVSRLTRASRYSDDAMRPLETVGLLVIDDLGMEYADEKGSFLATLDGLINCRYASDLRTVITTNLPAAEFKKRYGERVADRIRECGSFVELGGPSMRAKTKGTP